MTNAATSAKNLSDYICYFQRGLICRKSNLFCFLSQMTVGGIYLKFSKMEFS